MQKKPNIVFRIIRLLWSIINNTRKLLLNLLVFGLIIAFIGVIASQDKTVTPAQNAALVINIQGTLVDQKEAINPIDQLTQDAYGQPKQLETLLSDVLTAINHATTDSNIKMLVIDSSGMAKGSLAKLQDIGKAITTFKESNKPVYAVGGSYNQAQYYLASYADKILMNNKGMVSIEGFARYRIYHQELFEKLKINSHIFRVGTYKSALEPYLRNDMSTAAKTANQSWLNDLWQSYVNDVAEQRNITPQAFDINATAYLAAVEAANGNITQVAVDLGLVDVVDNNINLTKLLVDIVGESKNKLSYNKISLNNYLALISPQLPQDKSANIAIIVAKGTILNGHQPKGTIGGSSTSMLLRKARLNEDIKAVVLRIDSGGGSAYASEQIRNEVIALQAAGKPVIASMGSVAASGGYWIAANADQIIAQPTTITGSIGIFGMINTFEDSLASIGIHTDGVATKKFAGITVTRDLPIEFKQLMQSYIEHGYGEFLTLVSEARNLSIEEVDSIAQGRVWSGAKAKELGLVDQLGDLNTAITEAAKIAKLENYTTRVLEKQLTPMQELYRDLLQGAVSSLDLEPRRPSAIAQLLANVDSQLSQLSEFDDPQHLYLYCLECEQ
ncbi:signal peptide peptidase SppA [Psychrobium sp. 1_MG-2023]|uniref:signal peptide peptidase SppA n=1 Tax=Psychrobium sp. 1_MG-2023 TaxID=3062624 RepID=UPI000C32A1DF|nr:signal peptide peptidase SppA [Psychrobium sp. 1_MG-2023]MDP2561537.1 signal peptide peptidase SppA [Psychrobium sp. 1_MG-2023]PKF55000.1 signal peptide peptidase SppA [Alteromonadales bacterium alter-6D02]